MKRTTVFLPEDLQVALKRMAASEGRSEAEIIRSALAVATLAYTNPEPRLPLFASGTPDLAEHVDAELARGFGE